MQSLRHVHRIARFVLVWFALSIGVAIAAPLVHPQGLQLVCSASGSNKFIASDDGQAQGASLTLDCPLCAGVGAPPPQTPALFSAAAPRFFVLPLQDGCCLPLASAAPPPARGPPKLS
jgi:hypothetical protein